jgi:hypothetical protein
MFVDVFFHGSVVSVGACGGHAATISEGLDFQLMDVTVKAVSRIVDTSWELRS